MVLRILISFILCTPCYVSWCSSTLAQGPSAAKAGSILRVLTYNIHHGRGTDDLVDIPRIAAVIKALQPDLVALQEVDQRTRRTGGVDQTARLAELTQLHGQFMRQIDFEGGRYG